MKSCIFYSDNVAETMKQLKSNIDELDKAKSKLNDVSGQRDNLQNQINDKNDILAFNLEGYSFDPSISSPNEPVFTRHPA